MTSLVGQLLKKYATVYGNRRLNTVFINVRYQILLVHKHQTLKLKLNPEDPGEIKATPETWVYIF
jgi:hypothetical protein